MSEIFNAIGWLGLIGCVGIIALLAQGGGMVGGVTFAILLPVLFGSLLMCAIGSALGKLDKIAFNTYTIADYFQRQEKKAKEMQDKIQKVA